jgi:kinesin family protein 5
MPDNIEAKMKVSMVEIYNEKIKDLLDSSRSDLKIRSNKTNGIFIDGVT